MNGYVPTRKQLKRKRQSEARLQQMKRKKEREAAAAHAKAEAARAEAASVRAHRGQRKAAVAAWEASEKAAWEAGTAPLRRQMMQQTQQPSQKKLIKQIC